MLIQHILFTFCMCAFILDAKEILVVVMYVLHCGLSLNRTSDFRETNVCSF